jgi:CRISPR-associated protein Cas1
VAAKIDNQMNLIRKYKYHDTNPQFDRNLFEMAQYKKSLVSANSINEAMGFEGVSARYYWNCFKTLLKDPVFARRDYRPAPDYVNALLNLGYSFLANEITTSLIAKNFDLEIGFLHSVHYGRNSLALDVMEEFRALFIDAWILALVNKSQIKAEHFVIVNDDYRLNEDGFKKFCKLYHERLPDWRERFHNQANNLKTALMEGKSYEPYRE